MIAGSTGCYKLLQSLRRDVVQPREHADQTRRVPAVQQCCLLYFLRTSRAKTELHTDAPCSFTPSSIATNSPLNLPSTTSSGSLQWVHFSFGGFALLKASQHSLKVKITTTKTNAKQRGVRRESSAKLGKCKHGRKNRTEKMKTKLACVPGIYTNSCKSLGGKAGKVEQKKCMHFRIHRC